MKIDLNKASYDGKWFDFGEARLKIRPYPMSRTDTTIKDGAMVFLGDASMEMFTYCLTEWEGVVDADGKPLNLTIDVKKKIYDFKLGCVKKDEKTVSLSDFVLITARKLTEEIGAETKN
jgi:hypothetical protein